MSLIHRDACECMVSELDLFTVPPTQASIDRSQFIKYFPITSLDGGPIEFHITTSDLEYLDVNNIYLYTKNRILYDNGKGISPKIGQGKDQFNSEGIVFPINYFHSSRFKSLEVQLNNTSINEVDTLYPYRCYLETLLSFNRGAKESGLSSVLWVKEKQRR